jgi:hypothetical protein
MTINERRSAMAIPIAPTPVLEGEDAEKFWSKVKAEKNQKLELVPTPKQEEFRREIVTDAQRRQK